LWMKRSSSSHLQPINDLQLYVNHISQDSESVRLRPAIFLSISLLKVITTVGSTELRLFGSLIHWLDRRKTEFDRIGRFTSSYLHRALCSQHFHISEYLWQKQPHFKLHIPSGQTTFKRVIVFVDRSGLSLPDKA
jgi:hypothetical protein